MFRGSGTLIARIRERGELHASGLRAPRASAVGPFNLARTHFAPALYVLLRARAACAPNVNARVRQ